MNDSTHKQISTNTTTTTTTTTTTITTTTTTIQGVRPHGYHPMKKQGAIILGIGGDNSDGAVGTFYEGAMLRGYTTDATDDAMQANIVAAGYGK